MWRVELIVDALRKGWMIIALSLLFGAITYALSIVLLRRYLTPTGARLISFVPAMAASGLMLRIITGNL